MMFVQATQGGDLVRTREPVVLPDKDITELSEYSHDQFVIGLWSENDFILADRGDLGQRPQVMKEPLWCNNLCTDLIPLPGYHP